MSTREGVKDGEGAQEEDFLYIHLWIIQRCQKKKMVGMESVVFVVIHTMSVEYNNKVTVL